MQTDLQTILESRDEKGLEDFLEQNPNNAEANCALAISNLYRDWSKVKTYSERALELNPNLADAYFCLGYMYSSRSLYEHDKKLMDKAIEYFNRVLEVNPQHRPANFELGLIHYERKNYEEAVRRFEAALSGNGSIVGKVEPLLSPSDKRVYNEIGLVYHASGNLEKALESWEETIRLGWPEEKEQSLVLGIMYFNVGEYQKAMEEWRELRSKKIKIKGSEGSLFDMEYLLGAFPFELKNNWIGVHKPKYCEIDIRECLKDAQQEIENG